MPAWAELKGAAAYRSFALAAAPRQRLCRLRSAVLSPRCATSWDELLQVPVAPIAVEAPRIIRAAIAELGVTAGA